MKKQYDHHFICKSCNKIITVKTQAYERRIKAALNNEKYAWYCKSCRARELVINLSQEEKDKRQKLRIKTFKQNYSKLPDKEKEIKRKKRKQKIRNRYDHRSDEEKQQDSIKRRERMLKVTQNRSNKKKIEIGKKISKTKKEKFKNMSDDERKEFKRKRREEREIYFFTMSNDVYNYRMGKLQEGAKKYRETHKEEFNNIIKKMILGHKEWYDNLSDEEKKLSLILLHEGHKEWYDNLTDEEKKLRNINISNKIKEKWDIMPDEQYQGISNKHKEYHKNLKENDPDKYHEIYTKIGNRIKNTLNQLPDEEKNRRNNRLQADHQDWLDNLNDQEKEELKIKLKIKQQEYIDSLTDEEKHKISQRKSNNMKNKWDGYSDNQRNTIINSLVESRKNKINELNDEEKELFFKPLQDGHNEWFNNLSNEDKNKLYHNIFSNRTRNNLNIKFENSFNNSILKNKYKLIPEYPQYSESNHIWDYGVLENDKLIALVDLDGAFYHGNINDYDGKFSREEYDEKRSLSIQDNDVKIFIINELNFKNDFKNMIKLLILDYDKYINKIFNIYINSSFPNIEYTDKELIKSYNNLINLDPLDKYNKNISINTRTGDRLIQHFHPSIYHAHVKNKPSPYNAWNNDKLLKKCVENRIIYRNSIDDKKLLQGFNVSKIAPKVSVFSAGRAKLLIYKYLNEYNTIFDPFSGFSGRMLGAISLNKKYIGQDISPIVIKESLRLLQFLTLNGIEYDVELSDISIFQSFGKYECLFTCPPYNDKEQWKDVNLPNLSCDDWIDICLKHFECKKYLFIVDDTDKYENYIVDIIHNKSHLNKNNEYIILIDLLKNNK